MLLDLPHLHSIFLYISPLAIFVVMHQNTEANSWYVKNYEICDLWEQRVHDRNFTGREKVSQQEHESANRAKRKHWTMVRHAKIPHPEVLNMHTHTQMHITLMYLRKHDLTSFLFAYRCTIVRRGESLVVSDGLPWWLSLLLMIFDWTDAC